MRLLPLAVLALTACRPTPVVESPPKPKGVVVSVSAPASDAGAEILRKGGNAIDASVATAFALAVTWPEAGNIGGGGFMLVVPPNAEGATCFDFRETAPAAATADMFADPKLRTPHRRVGVPGTVAGLFTAHQRLGKLPWKDLVAPALVLARDGFPIDAPLAKSLNRELKGSKNDECRKVFGKPGGDEWTEGDRLTQPDLAGALERIADRGPAGFYEGPTADMLADEMAKNGGLITRNDLKGYKAIERAPLKGSYRGHEVYAMPPSSSGGTVLIQSLNILENFDLKAAGRYSAKTFHLTTEAMRRAYRDRAAFLGDPAFAEVPARLTEKSYAKELAAGIDPDKATPSRSLAGDIPIAGEGDHTTHFSVVDNTGTAASVTYTLESSWGGGVVVPGAGFVLNDEMNDFNPVPGVTTSGGQVGTKANLVAPGKRMVSSMCPTIVCKDGKPLLVTGSPGGRTIPNTTLCVVLNVVEFGMPLREAVDAPRSHHQWLPDKLRVEPELFAKYPALRAGLEKLGHAIDAPARQGDAHSIYIDPKTGAAEGAADRRISGKASRE